MFLNSAAKGSSRLVQCAPGRIASTSARGPARSGQSAIGNPYQKLSGASWDTVSALAAKGVVFITDEPIWG